MKRLINYVPGWKLSIVLAFVPFVVAVLVYMVGSNIRLAENPADKLMPSFETIWHQIYVYAATENLRTSQYLLWNDTLVSLKRILIGLGISSMLGILIGIPIGFLPALRRTFGPFFDAISLIPPLAVLPIFFIVFGLGETSKIVLIVFGTTPFLIRDVALAVAQIPNELIIKAQTLGASTWQMMIRVTFPYVLPRLLNSIRLSLGAAWLFLIAAEAIASEAGLGYRIFIVRRYLSMDIILFYVTWITLLAFVTDYLLIFVSRYFCRWHHIERAS